MDLIDGLLTPFRWYYASIGKSLLQALEGAPSWVQTVTILVAQWASTHMVILILANILYFLLLWLTLAIEQGSAARARGLIFEEIRNGAQATLRIADVVDTLRTLSFRRSGRSLSANENRNLRLPRARLKQNKRSRRDLKSIMIDVPSRFAIRFVTIVPVVVVGFLRTLLSISLINIFVWVVVIMATQPQWVQQLFRWVVEAIQSSAPFLAQVTPAAVVASGTLIAVAIAAISLSDLRGAVEYNKQSSVTVRKSLARMGVSAGEAAQTLYQLEKEALDQFISYIMVSYVDEVSSGRMSITSTGEIRNCAPTTRHPSIGPQFAEDRWSALIEYESTLDKKFALISEEITSANIDGNRFLMYRTCPRRRRDLLTDTTGPFFPHSHLGGSEERGLPQLLGSRSKTYRNMIYNISDLSSINQISNDDADRVAEATRDLVEQFTQKLIATIDFELKLRDFSTLVRRAGHTSFYKRILGQFIK